MKESSMKKPKLYKLNKRGWKTLRFTAHRHHYFNRKVIQFTTTEKVLGKQRVYNGHNSWEWLKCEKALICIQFNNLSEAREAGFLEVIK